MPRIAVIFSGGTIDSVGKDRLDNAWYGETEKRLNSGDLIRQLPELTSIAKLHEIPVKRVPSHALKDEDWLDLLRTIHQVFEAGEADGMVLAHGTNTIEETGYFLNLTLKDTKPVVLVGAMRPASAISADGYLNFLNAVRVAASPESFGKGCLIVMNDTIFNARDVTKTSTYRVEALQSRDLGPLGFADVDGKVVYYHVPVRKHTVRSEFDARTLTSLPRVDIVVSYAGADGVMIEAVAAAGAKGIVSAGTGSGQPTVLEEAALDRVRSEKGVVVCLCSRIGSGRVVRSPKLAQKGFVAGDNLQPWKARILLALALAQTNDPDEIQRMLDSH